MCSTNNPPTVLKCVPLSLDLVTTGARLSVRAGIGRRELASLEVSCWGLLDDYGMLLVINWRLAGVWPEVLPTCCVTTRNYPGAITGRRAPPIKVGYFSHYQRLVSANGVHVCEHQKKT